MAGQLEIQYSSTGQNIVITLTSLASAASRASAYLTNTIATDALVTVSLTFSTGTISGQKACNVYAYASVDGGTTFTGGAELGSTPGTDEAGALISPSNLILIGVISCPAQSATYISTFSVASGFGGNLPPIWGILVDNECGIAVGSGSAKYVYVYGQYT